MCIKNYEESIFYIFFTISREPEAASQTVHVLILTVGLSWKAMAHGWVRSHSHEGFQIKAA
jgi:hypothetical protein